MPPMDYPPSLPVASYPAPQFAPAMQQWPAPGAQARPQMAATPAPVQQTALPAPKLRAQMSEEHNQPARPTQVERQPPTRLSMPSPEQLGVACAKQDDSK